MEFMARGSLAHHTMMSGGNLDEALGQVYKYHFDYTDLTAFEVSAKQSSDSVLDVAASCAADAD